MNWIDNFVPPKIKSIFSRRDTPDNLWIKCPESGQMVFHKDLEANQFVVPGSSYHMRMTARQRLASFLDQNSFEAKEPPDSVIDPLKFRDEKRYIDRLKEARTKTGMQDAVLFGLGQVEGLPISVAVQDFAFMGGSLGVAAGGAIVATFELAIEHQCPAIIFTASGGARMQEGVLSLMQMPRTTAARQALREAGLPYIAVLTHPTTGGVTASYAMLGDIHIAEPGALIGFAGPRVIEQTIREKLPLGFQRSEFLHQHGMIDKVVHRHDLRQTIASLIRTLTHVTPTSSVQDEPAKEPLALTLDKTDKGETLRGATPTPPPSEQIPTQEPS